MKKIILFMFVLSCLFVLQPYEAQAAEYKSTELKIRGFDAQTMYSGKNKLHVIEHCEEENEDDIFEYHCEIKDTIISKNKMEMLKYPMNFVSSKICYGLENGFVGMNFGLMSW